jgi:hypothetical protein
MKERRTLEHLAPWLGILAAASGWALTHQVGSDSVFDDCRIGTGWFVILVCLAGLLLVAAGGYFSFDIWRQGAKETDGRRFVGAVGALLAVLAAFAIILQAISALILPRCLG